MKIRNPSHGTLLPRLLLLACCGLLFGCGGGGDGGSPTNPNDGSDDPVVTTLIEGADRELVSEAAMDYMTLLQTMDAPAARASLVSTLVQTDGVTTAALFEDGYTIHVQLDSGAQGALNTLDIEAINAGVEKAAAPPTMIAPVLDSADQDKGGFSPDAHAPTSKKVLVLVVNAPDMPGASGAADFVASQFELAGWDSADVVVKTRTTGTSTAITPDDLLDFAEYGVVVLFAHALYGSPTGGAPSLYVQACSAVNYAAVASAERNMAWNEMIAGGTLLTGGSISSADESFYLRADLFGSQSGTLPETLFYLVTPFSDRLIEPLDQRGAGSVLGWDNVFLAGDGYAGVKYFFQAMTGGDAPCDGEVYARPALCKDSVNPEDDSPAALDIFGDSSQLYLPAWAHVHFDGLPAGIVRAGIGLNYMEVMDAGIGQAGLVLDGGATDGDIDWLVPVQVEVVGSAVDADAVTLAAVQFHTQVTPGENTLRVDFSRQHIIGWPLRKDFVQANGRIFTYFTNVFEFEQNPHSNRYKLFNEYWPEGLDVYQPLVYEGEYLYIRSDRCFDRAQLEYIWGHDPIGIEDGHVVWLGGGACQFGGYDPNSMTWDEETEQMITWGEMVDQAWADFVVDTEGSWIDIIFQ